MVNHWGSELLKENSENREYWIDFKLVGIPDKQDNCRFVPNPLQEDVDSDNVGNACDNCKMQYNPDQVRFYLCF